MAKRVRRKTNVFPEWSFWDWSRRAEEMVSTMMGTQKDGIGRFVAGAIGIVIAICLIPLDLFIFLAVNKFQVGPQTKSFTKFVGVVLVIVAFGYLIAFFQGL